MTSPDLIRWAAILLSSAIVGCTAGRTQTGAGASAPLPGQPVQKTAPIPAHFKDLQYPAFQYEPPDPADYRVVLNNGAVVYLVQDSSLDLVDIDIRFDTRNVARTPQEAADLALYASLLENGGTHHLSPEQLEDSLEFIAAAVSAQVGDYGATLGLNSLGQYTYPLLGLLGEMALTPRYDTEIFDLNKKKFMESIAHRYDRPLSVLGIAYEYVMYGRHPFNWQVTLEEARAVQRNAMMQFKGRGFSPSRVVISASGRFDRAQLLDSLSRLLAEFDKFKQSGENPVPDFPGSLPPGIYLFDKEATQASIRVGFPCVKRPNPDYYPLSVANYIFGSGGFTSRLVAKVRTEAGLAYSVRSFVESDYHRRGTAGFFLQTKVESGAEAVSLCFAEMSRLADSGVTGEEFTAAKDGLVKSLPSLFDTPAATMDIFAQSELWNRDLDHFKKYPEIINGMNGETLLTAFRKYFIADSARIIIVGPKDKLLAGKSGEKFARFGKITLLTASELEKKPRK